MSQYEKSQPFVSIKDNMEDADHVADHNEHIRGITLSRHNLRKHTNSFSSNEGFEVTCKIWFAIDVTFALSG